jgi:hypothetical protein
LGGASACSFVPGDLGAGYDTARLWDPATGKHLRTLAGHYGGVRGVAFSPDGRLLATASDDETVRLWDPATGKRLRTLAGHTGPVRGVAFSPDGRLLATANGRTARLWDPATGERLRKPTGRGVDRVAFSPDGRLLATANGRTARLWDPATGERLRTLLILVNLSKGTEDKWWRNLTATDALTDDPDSEKVRAKALAILDFIFDVCNGSRPKPPGHRNHKPTSDEPAIVLMIDEVDMTTNDADRKEQLGLIASKCRSEGIILIIGSQRPFDKDLGGKTRAMLTDIVWGKLKARDLAQASGGLANLPDMNEYGQGNPGVFGIAPTQCRLRRRSSAAVRSSGVSPHRG